MMMVMMMMGVCLRRRLFATTYKLCRSHQTWGELRVGMRMGEWRVRDAESDGAVRRECREHIARDDDDGASASASGIGARGRTGRCR